MRRNNPWIFLFVVLTVCWSFYEMYPPTSRSLVQEFETRAVNRDTNFTGIVQRLQPLQQARPEREFANLQEAIGTNGIQTYFPFFNAKNEVHPNIFILNQLQREASGKIKLGLDLQGGTSFLVEMDTNKLANPQDANDTNYVARASDVSGALSQAVEVLRRRVDAFGVAEPIIQPAGGNRILIQLPGLSEADKESAKAQIQKAAYLEFRMVKEDSDEIIKNNEPIPPGYVLLKRAEQQPNGPPTIEQVIVKKRAENGLHGDIVKNAMAVRGNLGEPQIDFQLNADGAKRFGEVTRNNIGQRLAIVLDGELYSAPVIQSAIETGNGQITGHFMVEQAQELANVLQNPLRLPLKIVYSSDVDPTLGKDSIRSGIKAAIIGVIAVAVFMLVYYMFAGLVANVALMLNIIILLGVMCSIGTTLTLPGIAGVVLTIGMAVDANVLIYERIREELAAGKSIRGAVAAGYNKAFGTIFDSNLTTLISSVILIFMGTGPVKGFGVTLTIGITVSMFSALVVTRLIFNWMLDRDLLKRLKMLHIIRGAKFDFMRWAIPAFIASWTLILIGNGYGLHRGSKVLGVDFAGGVQQIYKFTTPKGAGNQDTVRKDVAQVLAPLNLGEVTPGIQRDVITGDKTLRLVLPYKEMKAGEQGISELVSKTLKEKLPQYEFSSPSVDSVGPTVGREIMLQAILASMLALFGILVYVAFRYEFSFAVGAVVAIIHDILMTLGCYFLAGRELNATTVAAVLTIIGFSINDTIVIFDRIREDLKLGMRGTFKEVMNQALNQTLSRTLITSGTVFLATLSLFIFGGGPVNDFAFTFLVGIITGTYSSIYIASALVLWWHKGERPAIGSTSQVTMQNTTTARV